jgi:2-succinyl-5-enolpyruvyl-6-hydroxy-3-cyclohexene-1-carboxylate synthase
VNPSVAFGMTLADELVRCGLREVVLAPGSRSTPLAMAFGALDGDRRIRVHVRIDERSAAFTALGLAKVSGLPTAILCTSGTAAANFHPAVIEADEAGVPLLVLTADRPPELRATGASQTIDQIKLYGGAVRWFNEVGAPDGSAASEGSAGMARYWRSVACQAWAHATGAAGRIPGPVHLNLPLREPLVPDGGAVAPIGGRPDGRPWTSFAAAPAPSVLDLPWTPRGVVVAGDGAGPAPWLLELADQSGWPVLAEPSSGLRSGPSALAAYQYLLGSPEFLAGHQPDLIITAGRPGLSRAQTAFLRDTQARHVVVAQGPDRWADPVRAASDVTGMVRLSGISAGGWIDEWRRADHAVRAAVDAELDAVDGVSEPRLARDLAFALPEGALLWTGSSMPVRDLDCHMPARVDVRVLASRGASGIDGTTSAAIGAALGHDGPAFALLGDLAFVHDAPGLAIGPREPRPDLCLIVVNNDGGGIFSTLEQAAFPGFERLFGTPHGAGLHHLAAAFGVPYHLLDHPDDLAKAIQGRGLRIVEVRTDRAAGAELRAHLRAVATRAAR